MTCPGLGPWFHLLPPSQGRPANIFFLFSWVINYFFLAGSFWSACKHAVILPAIKKLFLACIFPSSYSPFISLVRFSVAILERTTYTSCLWLLYLMASTSQKWLLSRPPVLSILRNPMVSFQFSSYWICQQHWTQETLLLETLFTWPLLIVPTLSNLFTLEGPRTHSLELFSMIFIFYGVFYPSHAFKHHLKTGNCQIYISNSGLSP